MRRSLKSLNALLFLRTEGKTWPRHALKAVGLSEAAATMKLRNLSSSTENA
jgi:hypothetical protein